MNTIQLSNSKAEHQLFSKEAIKLPPRQRLDLLLKAKRYPIVRKRTSAVSQLKEMIDFYHLCCLMLAQYFPTQKAENNFFTLSLIASLENPRSIISEKLEEAFRLLEGYEELEAKITSIQMLFYQYHHSFPELYEAYNLETIATQHISDILQEAKQITSNAPQLIEKTLERWELLS